MDAGVIAALLGSATSLVVAGIGGVRATRTSQRQNDAQRELEEIKGSTQKDLELIRFSLDERAASARREEEAEKVLARYREPLVAAAYDLQRRLFNIINKSFLEIYGEEGHERQDDAIKSTLFRFAQYFGWTEVVRREVQFLQFREAEETRKVAELQAQIAELFASDGYVVDGESRFMIWADEQRAIGETMIVRENGALDCLGYAGFVDAYDPRFSRWLSRVDRDLRARTGWRSERLEYIQGRLVDLVQLLDKDELRYDQSGLERASRASRAAQHGGAS